MYVVSHLTPLFQRLQPLARIALLAAFLPLSLRADIETQTGSTGSGLPIDNSQPSLGVTWVIATQGVFPSREGDPVADPFIGEIRPIAYNSGAIDNGWVECRGQVLAINTNQALFALLGTQFGGNGTTNFALPDLRGRVPIGTGAGAGLTPRVIGETDGTETHTLSAGHLPAHSHTYSGAATGSTGSGTSLDNLQPSLALTFAVVNGGGYPLPSGWIRIFAFNFAPGGHVPCDGRLLPISTNQVLFASLGTSYGGDGTSTFAVPDLRGRSPLGVGQGPGLSNRTIGALGGIETITLTSTEMPAHVHSYSGGSTGTAGGGQAHSTLQPFTTIRPLISPYGVFANMTDESPGVGEIRLMASPTMPNPDYDWFPCDGSLRSIAGNEALFVLLGTSFGGDGIDTFALPDLRGRLPVGSNPSQLGDRSQRYLGGQWGTESVTLTSGQLPAHTHTVPTAPVITGTLAAGGSYGTALSTYTITASGTVNSYSATGLPAGLSINTANGQITGTPTEVGTFNVTIGATNNVGTGTNTLVLTIAKAAQTITWTAPTNKTFGDAAFTVSATSSSSLAVTYSVFSGNATISGNTVTLTGAGSVTLRATQAGNANYLAATAADTTFTVSKATATVTLGNLAATFDTAAHAATATTSPSGLTVNFTYEGSSAAPTNAGTYAVVGTITDANYQGTASGTLVITKAPATVTLGSLSPTYNASAHAATATTSPSGLTVNFTYDSSSTAPTNAGSYAVVGTISNANYQGTASGTLVIAKATATVTLGSLSSTYDGAPHAASATTSPSGLTVNFTYDSSSTAPTAAGSYAVVGTVSNANYQGSASGTLNIGKALLTVTADNLSRGYGAENPTLTSAVAGFLGGDTLAVTTGAPVLTTTAMQTSPRGTYPITVDLGTLAAANYIFSPVDGTLTVTKAVLTVTPDNKSRVYGAANPALTATITGFLNNDTAAVITGTPTLGTTADVSSAVGSYPITADISGLSASDYLFDTVPGALAVSKATVTVTASDALRTYGAENPTFTATFSGFVNGESASVLTGAPALTTSASAATPAGPAVITPALGTLAATNYTFAFEPGTLTINKAPLTLTADPKSKLYGAANPALTATLSGFVNGETLGTSGVTGAASVTTTGTSASAVGTYPITPAAGTLTADNYSVATFIHSVLTVDRATLTVTAEPKARVYGAVDPTFTALITGYVNNDTAAVLTGSPAFSTTATATSDHGSYSITVSAGTLAAANYTFTLVPSSLTVSPATLTVKANNKSRLYGAADPAFDATITGFLNGDTAATTITGAPGFTTDAGSGSPVGNYLITPTQGSLVSANYTFAFATGTLTVERASATVTLGNLSQTYTGSPRAASATTNPGGLTVTLAYGGNATAPVNAGSYEVSAVISDANHSGSASGTLEIAKATQTVTFASPSNSTTVGAPVALNASATSGLPVTFELVSGNGSLSGSTLVLNGVAPVVVRATQGGDQNYLPASAQQTFSATAKREQTIAFPSLSDRKATDAAFTLEATATSGLPVTFSVVSGPAMLNSNTLALTGVTGRVVLRASQPGDATWAPAPDVIVELNVTSDQSDVFFGDIGNRGNEKVGDIAAVLPPDSKEGTLLIVIPGFDVSTIVTFVLDANGGFSSTVTVNVVAASSATSVVSDRPPTAAAPRTLTVHGRLQNGILAGRIDELDVTFTSTVLPHLGATAGIAGYYASSSLDSAAGGTFLIVGPQNQALVVTSTSALSTGAVGTVAADGKFQMEVSGATISGSVDAPSTTVSGMIVMADQSSVSFSGLSGTTLRTDRLINLSSRGRIGPGGDRTLITGVVISGVEPKRVLLRAAGPSLSAYGIAEAHSNPRLRLFNQAGQVIAENDDWNAADATTFSQVGAFAFPAGSRDAALVITLQPGAYTVHVLDGDETGVVLAEIYDASANPQAEYQRLLNISSRGMVQAGDGVVIGGFVVNGNSPKRVLVRGIGPALIPLGVAGAVADPRLSIFSADRVLAQNDDWGTPTAMSGVQVAATAAEIAAASRSVGAFALGAGTKDAAVIVTLSPGVYTAQLSSATGATGVGLVEIYELPE